MICTASGSKSHLGKVAYIDDDYNYAFGGFMGMVTPKSGLVPSISVSPDDRGRVQGFHRRVVGRRKHQQFEVRRPEEVSVPYPSLPEQRRIVGILDEAFDGIATAKANAEKNLQNARALFESHLQCRLHPARRGVGGEDRG